MNLRIAPFLFIALTLIIPVAGFARERTDVIVMKNGDRLTGEIKGVSSGVLYAKLDYIDGTVSIQWSKVARLESTQQFIVKTQDGSVHSGTLKTVPAAAPDEPMKLDVTNQSEQEVVLNRSSIVKLDQTSERFWQRFDGAISFDSSYTKGNQSTQYNLSTQTDYVEERWRIASAFSSNLTSSSKSSASTRNQINLGALRLLPWKNYFYGGLGSFLQSSVQGIKLQTNVGAGIGRFFKNTNRTSISVIAGIGWQATDYNPSTIPIGRQNVATGLIAANISAFKFKRTKFNITAELFPAISEPGRVFFDTNATYYLKLFSNLSWNVSFYGSWDSQPPGKLAGSDYGTSSGVSWTFGNR